MQSMANSNQESILRMDLESLVKTASEMNHTLDKKGKIPDARFCKKTKTKKAEWKEDELSFCKKYTINLEAIIRRFEELDVDFKPEVVQAVIQRLFQKFLQVVRNRLPDFEVEEFLEKFKNTVTEARANIKTKGSRRINLKRGDNKGIPRETKEKQYEADRLKLEVMQRWVKMNELMLEAFELREGLKKWKITVREEIKEFLKTMYWTARIQGLDDTLKTKYALVNEIREVLEDISFDWSSLLRKPHQSNSTAPAPVLTISELRPMKEEVLEDVVERKASIQQTNRNKVTPTLASTSVPLSNHGPVTQNFVYQPPQNFTGTPASSVHNPNLPPVPFLNHQQTDDWLRTLYDAGNLYLMLPVWIPLRPNNHEVGANIRQNTPCEVPHFNTHPNANNQYIQNTSAQLNMPPHNNDDRYEATPRGQLPTHWFLAHW